MGKVKGQRLYPRKGLTVPTSNNNEPEDTAADHKPERKLRASEPDNRKYEAPNERKLLMAGVRLLEALRQYQAAVRLYEDGGRWLDLDEQMEAMGWGSASLETELVQLHRAIEVIEEDIPIAKLSGNGHPWKPRLSPKWIDYFLGLAEPGDRGYVPQVMDLIAIDEARELDAPCGRPTKSGAPCQAIPVHWPGRGRIAGCNTHLTSEEKANLQEVWDGIESDHGCPGCPSGPGETCNEDASTLVVVDGQWPRIRHFSGRRLHDVRLALV